MYTKTNNENRAFNMTACHSYFRLNNVVPTDLFLLLVVVLFLVPRVHVDLPLLAYPFTQLLTLHCLALPALSWGWPGHTETPSWPTADQPHPPCTLERVREAEGDRDIERDPERQRQIIESSPHLPLVACAHAKLQNFPLMSVSRGRPLPQAPQVPDIVLGSTLALGTTSMLGPTTVRGAPSTLGPTSKLGPTSALEPTTALGPTSMLEPLTVLGPTDMLGPTFTLGPSLLRGSSRDRRTGAVTGGKTREREPRGMNWIWIRIASQEVHKSRAATNDYFDNQLIGWLFSINWIKKNICNCCIFNQKLNITSNSQCRLKCKTGYCSNFYKKYLKFTYFTLI